MKNFTIVIPHYNDLRILDCIKSIKNQDYPKDKIQILVQDNFSEKEIIEKIRNLLSNNDKFFSEKDAGIFDALDKGYSKANNVSILSLGADDRIIDQRLFSKLNKLFSTNKFDIIFVGVVYTNIKGKIIRKWPVRKFGLMGKFLGFQYPHFGTIAKKEIFQKFKFYNKDLMHNNDHLFFLNLDHNAHNIGYLDSYAISLGFGGNSSANLKRIITINLELFFYILRHKPYFSFGFLLKPFYKLYEYVLSKKNR